jgi:hypothetical protein
MPRIRIGITRYRALAKEIADATGFNPPPVCRIGRGRITILFKQSGATRWPEGEKFEQAFRIADLARSMISADKRRLVRRRSRRAVVVIYEDRMMQRGCDVTARWHCVVPSVQE